MVGNPNRDADCSPKLPVDVAEAYRQIGRTLLVAEASTFSIGIPWLPATPRAEKLRTEFSPPLRDFVRLSLLGVNTNFLESYLEDIEELAPDRESERYLAIVGPRFFERYMLSGLLFSASFAVLMLASIWVKAAPSLVLGVSFLVSLIVAGISLFVCSEESRRSTFHWLIYEELLRRRGANQDESGTSPLYALGGEIEPGSA